MASQKKSESEGNPIEGGTRTEGSIRSAGAGEGSSTAGDTKKLIEEKSLQKETRSKGAGLPAGVRDMSRAELEALRQKIRGKFHTS